MAEARSKASEDRAPGKSERFPVVGVGASAGGLAPTSELLRHLGAKPGIAVVVVQHLDPTHASSLVEILARATSLPVCAATDGMVVERDHVYVLPPNANILVVAGALRLTPRDDNASPHLPIDRFFASLASDQTTSAVGVLLSGTGSDGAAGTKAIKGESGVTLAQDATAEYPSMPESAIAEGCVDFVMPPEAIARELVRIGEQSVPLASADDGPDFQRILSALRRATGVDFANYMAKEELQAANEELRTVNEEMAVRNAEGTKLNDDLMNVLTSVEIPIVILGRDGRIRRFTPAAAKAFGLCASDLGRTIGEAQPLGPGVDLARVVAEVLDRLGTVTRTVQDAEQRWYQLAVRPYLTADNRIDGTVITAYDIDPLQRSRELVAEARKYAENIVDAVRECLVVLERDLRVRSANRAFYKAFDLTAREVEGRTSTARGRASSCSTRAAWSTGPGSSWPSRTSPRRSAPGKRSGARSSAFATCSPRPPRPSSCPTPSGRSSSPTSGRRSSSAMRPTSSWACRSTRSSPGGFVRDTSSTASTS